MLDGYYLHLLAERKLFQLAGMTLGSLDYAWDDADAIIASLTHVENQADYISCSLIWAKEGMAWQRLVCSPRVQYRDISS